MKLVASLVFMAVMGTADAYDETEPINDAFELQEWCKSETEAYYIGKGITPYNWSADWWEEGNTLHVKGRWLIGHDYVVAECRVSKGARRKYAIYQLSDRDKER
jgi:hypothetical protein